MATSALEKIPLTTLRLIIPAVWDASLDSCEWVILDRAHHVLRRGRDPVDELPQCDEVEVVVAAVMVGFIPAQLPPGNHNKVLAALPFLVEGSLISPPEEVHAVLAEQKDGQVIVAVIQKLWVRRILERLARAGTFPQRMFPETLLPELPPSAWALVCRGTSSFVRSSHAQGFPLEVDINHATPPFVLGLALEQADVAPARLTLYGEMPQHAAEWEALLGLSLEHATRQEWLTGEVKSGFNLLQGELQPKGGVWRRLAPFQPAAVALAVLLVLQGIFAVADYALLARQNSRLDQDMVTQFKSTFPDSHTIVDAPLQMQRNLDDLKHGAGLGGNADFLPLLATVTSSIGAVSADRLRGMDYQNGRLVLRLLLPDLVQAQAMRQRVNAPGLSATVENPHQTAAGLELQLVISGHAS